MNPFAPRSGPGREDFFGSGPVLHGIKCDDKGKKSIVLPLDKVRLAEYTLYVYQCPEVCHASDFQFAR